MLGDAAGFSFIEGAAQCLPLLLKLSITPNQFLGVVARVGLAAACNLRVDPVPHRIGQGQVHFSHRSHLRSTRMAPRWRLGQRLTDWAKRFTHTSRETGSWHRSPASARCSPRKLGRANLPALLHRLRSSPRGFTNLARPRLSDGRRRPKAGTHPPVMSGRLIRDAPQTIPLGWSMINAKVGWGVRSRRGCGATQVFRCCRCGADRKWHKPRMDDREVSGIAT